MILFLKKKCVCWYILYEIKDVLTLNECLNWQQSFFYKESKKMILASGLLTIHNNKHEYENWAFWVCFIVEANGAALWYDVSTKGIVRFCRLYSYVLLSVTKQGWQVSLRSQVSCGTLQKRGNKVPCLSHLGQMSEVSDPRLFACNYVASRAKHELYGTAIRSRDTSWIHKWNHKGKRIILGSQM